MIENNQEGYWTEDVKIKYHPPKGTFEQNAQAVVTTLMQGAKDDAHLALDRLLFYMNRAGDKLSNSVELNKAKIKLESLVKNQKH